MKFIILLLPILSFSATYEVKRPLGFFFSSIEYRVKGETEFKTLTDARGTMNQIRARIAANENDSKAILELLD